MHTLCSPRLPVSPLPRRLPDGAVVAPLYTHSPLQQISRLLRPDAYIHAEIGIKNFQVNNKPITLLESSQIPLSPHRFGRLASCEVTAKFDPVVLSALQPDEDVAIEEEAGEKGGGGRANPFPVSSEWG